MAAAVTVVFDGPGMRKMVVGGVSRLSSLGVSVRVLSSNPGSGVVDSEKLGALQASVGGKVVFVTRRRAVPPNPLLSGFAVNGFADAVGGSVAAVVVGPGSKGVVGELVVHEALHLLGVRHCGTRGCLMCYHFCGGGLGYCLTCPVMEGRLVVCGP